LSVHSALGEHTKEELAEINVKRMPAQ